jgi:adenosylcobinamide-phosphate synthase
MMAITLTLFALLTEATFGYPDWLVRTIGHPVTWMGRLISALDRSLNREHMGTPWRRTAGVIALIVTIGTVAVIAHILEVTLYELPFGTAVVAIAASTLLAQRSFMSMSSASQWRSTQGTRGCAPSGVAHCRARSRLAR